MYLIAYFVVIKPIIYTTTNIEYNSLNAIIFIYDVLHVLDTLVFLDCSIFSPQTSKQYIGFYNQCTVLSKFI